ncbi:MAG TPA: glycosyltransferase [Bryobacteraceae bacterium]|jgi:spore maturation protein CgeB|nr:glycosyltransferase [Bryobacteraceae bacterium]
MKLVIFGLTLSSSWGNGHATLWRGLCAALARRGHRVIFFERDVPYYASTRDMTELPGGELILYGDWDNNVHRAQEHLRDCDAAMVTSYCPDGIAASRLVLDNCPGLRIFYDLDTPITLSRLARGEQVAYVGENGYRGFDLVLSYTGGKSLEDLTSVLGAARVETLYGSVDPAVHRLAPACEQYRAFLSYMGTYSPDRDAALNALFIEPAKQFEDRRFLIGGSLYNGGFPWRPNIFYVGHLHPALHAEFYCSSRITLNVTREPMAQTGYCPSGRLFEAAACGTPVLSDYWEGLEEFYAPGSEILIGRESGDAVEALQRSDEELARIGRSARERTLDCHTSDHRARRLEEILSHASHCTEVTTACGE